MTPLRSQASVPNPDESPPTDTGIDPERPSAAAAGATEEEKTPRLSRPSFKRRSPATITPLDPPSAGTTGNARSR